MPLFLLSALAFAGMSLEAEATKEVITLHLRLDEGQRFDEKRPAVLSLTCRSDEGERQLTADLSQPLAVACADHLSGGIEAFVCDEARIACKKVTHRFAVRRKVKGPARKMRVHPTKVTANLLWDGEPLDLRSRATIVQQDYQPDVEEAYARAREKFTNVILFFSSVQSPEALEVEAFLDSDPAVLDRLALLVPIDLESAVSWPLQQRYAVSEAPTVVITDRHGEELSRYEGFPAGRVDFGVWLITMAGAGRTSSTTGLVYAALQSARTNAPDVDVHLEAASNLDHLPEYRIARVIASPNLEDAEWLVEKEPEKVLAWVPDVLAVVGDDETWQPVLERALHTPPADLVDAAERHAVLASMAGDPVEQAHLYRTAAYLLRSQLTGDFYADRAHVIRLLDYWQRAGERREAQRLLYAAIEAFPDDPTFHLLGARHFFGIGDFSAARYHADLGLKVAWGDNRLELAIEKARALVAEGKHEQARAFVDGLLEQTGSPPDDVRSARLRHELVTLVEARPE